MVRLKTFVTRLTILALLMLAIWLGRDAVVRAVFISAAQSQLGSKIEIGQLRASWSENKLHLSELSVADPRYAFTNLFQAKSAVVQLDRQSLLKRQIVVTDGAISGVVFGAPRTTSGLLHSQETANEPGSPDRCQVEVSPLDPYQAWLDQFVNAESEATRSTPNLNAAAEMIFNRIEESVKQEAGSIDQLAAQILELRGSIRLDGNPLRNRQQFDQADRKLAVIRTQINSVAGKLTALDQEIANGLEQLQTAAKVDRKLLVEQIGAKSLDGSTLSELLLKNELKSQIEDILSMYFAFRASVPDPATDFVPQRIGRKIRPEEYAHEPSFLIQKINMDGEGRLAGRKFNFSGLAKNITSEPELMQVPAEFTLRAQGNTHILVECTIDRTGERSGDYLAIRCPDFEMGGQLLGSDDTLKVKISPSRIKFDIELFSNNERVEANLRFEYDNLVMQIESLDELAGGQSLADRINLELANLTGFVINAEVDGPIANPSLKFQSDLGTKLATKINEVCQDKTEVVVKRLDKQLKLYKQTLVEKLAEQVRSTNQRLETELVDAERQLTADLRNQMEVNRIDRRQLR